MVPKIKVILILVVLSVLAVSCTQISSLGEPAEAEAPAEVEGVEVAEEPAEEAVVEEPVEEEEYECPVLEYPDKYSGTSEGKAWNPNCVDLNKIDQPEQVGGDGQISMNYSAPGEIQVIYNPFDRPVLVEIVSEPATLRQIDSDGMVLAEVKFEDKRGFVAIVILRPQNLVELEGVAFNPDTGYHNMWVEGFAYPNDHEIDEADISVRYKTLMREKKPETVVIYANGRVSKKSDESSALIMGECSIVYGFPEAYSDSPSGKAWNPGCINLGLIVDFEAVGGGDQIIMYWTDPTNPQRVYNPLDRAVLVPISSEPGILRQIDPDGNVLAEVVFTAPKGFIAVVVLEPQHELELEGVSFGDDHYNTWMQAFLPVVDHEIDRLDALKYYEEFQRDKKPEGALIMADGEILRQ